MIQIGFDPGYGNTKIYGEQGGVARLVVGVAHELPAHPGILDPGGGAHQVNPAKSLGLGEFPVALGRAPPVQQSVQPGVHPFSIAREIQGAKGR